MSPGKGVHLSGPLWVLHSAVTPLGREEVAWVRQAPPGSGKPLQPLSHRGRHLVRGICNRAASAARPGFPPPRSKTDRRDDVGPFRECSLLSAPSRPPRPLAATRRGRSRASVLAWPRPPTYRVSCTFMPPGRSVWPRPAAQGSACDTCAAPLWGLGPRTVSRRQAIRAEMTQACLASFTGLGVGGGIPIRPLSMG